MADHCHANDEDCGTIAPKPSGGLGVKLIPQLIRRGRGHLGDVWASSAPISLSSVLGGKRGSFLMSAEADTDVLKSATAYRQLPPRLTRRA
jgi:hypothetical protein